MDAYHPYADLEDNQLVNLANAKEDATDLELELALRLTHALETIEGYDEEASRAIPNEETT